MGLSPADFWALSIGEWRALTGACLPQDGGLDHAGLRALMQQTKGDDNGGTYAG